MKKKILGTILALGTALAACTAAGVSVMAAQAGSVETAAPAIQKMYTINHSFGDGQKVTNVVLEYDTPIDLDSLSLDTYAVENRIVTGVHTNDRAEATDTDVTGNYVVLDLLVQTPILEDSQATDGRMQGQTVIDSASVQQVKDVRSTEGAVIPASDAVFTTSAGDGGIMGNDAIITPDLDVFEDNHYYNDPDTHAVLHYNLFKPEGWEDSGKTYPLVLFIPDASAVGTDWETVLQCGNGGTVWASDDWQAGNPCFVVAMIYEDKYINDYNEYYESWMDGTMDLIRDLAAKYPVDTDRIYTTGTSMGAMASMVMMEKDPDLFAAAYLAAGQWADPEAVKDIWNQNIFFLMSEDDPSYPRAATNVAVWEREGAKVARQEIDVTNYNNITASVASILSMDGNVRFLSIEKGHGTIDLAGNPLPGGHRATFRVAYDLPGIKEWLFAQHR